MATPTILIDSATGSDSLASGAGPGTAITGTTGRTKNAAGETKFGFFGATDDFSGVATDGSAVAYVAIATAGQRNFSAMTAIKNTRQTGSDGAITSGTAILTVGSTTGWTANDLIKVTGAGAAGIDFYERVLSVDSPTQATLNSNAGTTVGPSATWENPKQATFGSGQGVNTGTTDTAWAIGGKRASLNSTSSNKLTENNSGNGDAMPGWILEYQSGHTETWGGRMIFRRAGDTNSGPITLRGASGTRPIITSNQNDIFIIPNAAYWQCYGIELRNTNATKTASIAIDGASGVSGHVMRDLVISHSTNKFWKGILTVASGGRCSISSCDIGNTASHGIDITDSPRLFHVIGNYIHSCGGTGIKANNTDLLTAPVIKYNIIVNCSEDGIYLKSSATDVNRGFEITGNTINGNTGDGIQIDHTGDTLTNTFIVNNILSNNGGYGINWSAAGVTTFTLQAYGVQMLNNDFYNNTSGKYLPTGLDTAGVSINESILNPAFTNSAGGDYSIGGNLKALGYPSVSFLNSSTRSYVDIGAVQRTEPGGSGYLLVAP